MACRRKLQSMPVTSAPGQPFSTPTYHADCRCGSADFGSGPIRGFAVVHCLGILTSMFSAVFAARGLTNVIYGLSSPAQGRCG